MQSLARIAGLALILLAWPRGAAALDPAKAITQFMHTAWQTRDGLPQNTITAIAQTPDGYLWLGTREGLARFDGLRFTVFTSETTPAITQNQVLALLADREGRLWIGTWGGGVVRLEAGRFTRYGAKEGLANELVAAMFQDRHGRIWAGTDGGGLTRLDGDRFVAVAANGMGQHVRAIAETAEGIWVGSDLGLSHITADGASRTYGVGHGLTNAGVRVLLASRNGTLWIGTDHGLFRFERGAIAGYPEGHALAHDLVFALKEDKAGSMWIGTDARGLRRLNGSRLDSFTSKEGLSNDSVYSLLEDREGNLWIGTNLGGLNRLREGRITPLGRREGLSNDYARATFETTDGSLWIGTEGGGVNRLHNGQIATFTTKDGLSNDVVFSMVQDAAGTLWIGTDSGLTRYADGRFVSVTRNTVMANETVLSLAAARDGTIWMGTYAAGLVRYRDGTFTAYNTKNGFPHNTVNVIHEARDGTLWIGTRGGGLTRLSGGTFTTFTKKDGLSDDLVFSIHEEPDGTLWFGTYGGGLTRRKGDAFAIVNRKHGLFDDVIHRIVDDGHGQYWMSTNRGIFRASKSELAAVADGSSARVASVAYGPRDGMRDAECNGGASAGTRTRDGRIWFPTIAGVISFDPAAMSVAPVPPPVAIEEVMVDGERVDALAPVQLAPSAQMLEIDFTALSLSAPEGIRFRYRLDGLEDEWVDAETRRTAYYSKLPPGDYQLQVIAASPNGAWAPMPATLAITVAPTLFETAWFRAGIVIALVLAVPLIYQARVRGLTAQKAALERLVTERTAALEAANARLAQLAQEDGLTGLLNRRAFDDALDGECRRAIRSKSSVALLMLDIDHFKSYNDQLGHQAGDASLRAVAQAVRQAHRRAGEIVARYGGEELAVIIPGAGPAAAAETAEYVRRAVHNLALPHPASSAAHVVTVSVGVACCGGDVECSRESLVAAADRALYQAKAGGRNRVEIAAG